jgi:hypothetical protein
MTFSYLQANLATLKNNNWEPVMSSAAFVLMNCDLIPVPLQVGRSSIVTIYCGARRAIELRGRWNQKAAYADLISGPATRGWNCPAFTASLSVELLKPVANSL